MTSAVAWHTVASSIFIRAQLHFTTPRRLCMDETRRFRPKSPSEKSTHANKSKIIVVKDITAMSERTSTTDTTVSQSHLLIARSPSLSFHHSLFTLNDFPPWQLLVETTHQTRQHLQVATSILVLDLSTCQFFFRVQHPVYYTVYAPSPFKGRFAAILHSFFPTTGCPQLR